MLRANHLLLILSANHLQETSYSLILPSFPVGPGFVSTSPAISSNASTTEHTLRSKHTPTVPRLAISLTSALGTEPLLNMERRTLPHPHLRNVYPSTSDRQTTTTQPWNRRGVLFMTSPTPQLAALHWTGSGRQAYPDWRVSLTRARHVPRSIPISSSIRP